MNISRDSILNRDDKIFRILPKGFFPGAVIIGSFETYLKTVASEGAFVVASRSAFESRRSFFEERFGLTEDRIFFVQKEPTMKDRDTCAARLARISGYDPLIAFGGGSALDLAKALKQIEKRLLIAIPTTPGSGSEASPFAVLLDEEGRKKAINDRALLPDVAVLDSSLLQSIPRDVLGPMLYDIIAHAVESSYSRFSSALSRAYAREAVRMIERVPAHLGEDDWSDIQVAGFFAGMAQGMAGTGICHALAHVIGGKTGIPHALAVSLFLSDSISLTAQREKVAKLLERADLSPKRLTALLERIAADFSFTVPHVVLPGDFSVAETIEAVQKDPCFLTHPFRLSEAELERLLRARLHA